MPQQNTKRFSMPVLQGRSSLGHLCNVITAFCILTVIPSEAKAERVFVETGLIGLESGAVAGADYDGDGDKDILVSGEDIRGQYLTKLYQNQGAGQFTEVYPGFANVAYSAAAWADYDGDGDPDLLLSGSSEGGARLTALYRNDGAGVFTEVITNIPGVSSGKVAWGDYDADGDQDILIAGNIQGGQVTKVYRNDGGGVFADTNAGLLGVSICGLSWGDYDGDGDLDIVLSGVNGGSTRVTKIYRFDGRDGQTGDDIFVDIGASLPSAYYSSVSWGDFDLDGDLDVLISGEISASPYNILRVYRNTGGNFADISAALQGMANSESAWFDYDADGDLDIVIVGQSSYYVYRNNGNSTFTNISGSSQLKTGANASIEWGDFNSDGHLDILVGAADTGFIPYTYIYNGTGSGSFSSSYGRIVPVRMGTLSSADYDGDGLKDLLSAGLNVSSSAFIRLYRNQGNGIFGEVINSIATGVSSASSDWGDYDGDGDPDLALTGYTSSSNISYIYRNDGSGAFTNIGAGLVGVSNGSVDWGDYDNDGDLDLLLSGISSGGRVTKLYRNNGGGSFTDIAASLPQVSSSAVAWGDFDKDGDLDAAICGHDGSSPITKLYRNQGGGSFADTGINFSGASSGTVAWGDYDNDSDLDLLLTSTSQNGSLVYRNDGNDTFTNIYPGYPGGYAETGSWGDYDNDGDLDVLLTGSTTQSFVYRNDGNDTFTDMSADLVGVEYGDGVWIDFDNDGDKDIVIEGGDYYGKPLIKMYRNEVGYTLTGNISDTQGPISGVSLRNGYGKRTSTNAAGNYYMPVVVNSGYRLAPAKTGYSFTPSMLSGTATNNATGLNFSAQIATYTVSGQVLTSQGAPLAGVVITGTSGIGSQTTDASGNYIFPAVTHGTSFSLTPALSGYRFSPVSSSFSNISGNQTRNFTATVVYSISGQILLDGNPETPLVGVSVNAGSLGTVTTDTSGNYVISNILGGTSYTVTPNKTWYSFTPANYSGTINSNTTHNFQAALARHTIYGEIFFNGGTLAGVTVTGSGNLGERVTDSTGQFAFYNVPHGTAYTLTPTLTGYDFDPEYISSSLDYGDAWENFVARIATYDLGGVITAGGRPLAGVSVTGSSGLGTEETDDEGRYLFKDLALGMRYVLTPSKTGFVFTPSIIGGTIVRDTVRNFTGSTSFVIQGSITSGGQPLSGVSVVGSGGLGTKTTDAQGRYSFGVVNQGTAYTLTPYRAGYSFEPQVATGTLQSNVQANFAGSQAFYTISGVIQKDGVPLAEVSVNGSSGLGTRLTDAQGRYAFSNLNPGSSYAITPNKTGYAFQPPSASVTMNNNATANFAAAVAWNIEGTITKAGVPLAGVTVRGSGTLGTRTTDFAGKFVFANVATNTVYVLTPTRSGYTFNPQAAQGTVTGNATHNFSAVEAFSITGSITVDGRPLAGVRVVGSGSLGAQVTNASGSFSFNNVATSTSYSLVPSLEGYAMIPVRVSATLTQNARHSFEASVKDSDGDGVSDVQERVDGTNPGDSGSVVNNLGSTVCSEWNGFLGMMNITELVNISSAKLTVNTVLYGSSGQVKARKSFSIKPGSQHDLVVNTIEGFARDSYGKICFSIENDRAGDLDGRMVYYMPETDGGYSFAFAMPFAAGLTGKQYVQFDTYAYSGVNLPVTNWVQITNLDYSPQVGYLHFYDAAGVRLKKQKISLNSGGRMDVSAHLFGPDKVGLIEWAPVSADARFQIRNVHYYYDNAMGLPSFGGAFQLEAIRGSGEPLVVPFQTTNAQGRLLISNTSAALVKASIKVYAADGSRLLSRNVEMAPQSTIDFTAASGNALPEGSGVITLDADRLGSLIASYAQPQWVANEQSDVTGEKLQFIYAMYAAEPMGSVLKGSYNTFLGQTCSLLLANGTSKGLEALVSMTDYKGLSLLKNETILVPAWGMVDYNLCSKEKTAGYGVVQVQSSVPNSLVASVIRKGLNEQYCFPTPVR